VPLPWEENVPTRFREGPGPVLNSSTELAAWLSMVYTIPGFGGTAAVLRSAGVARRRSSEMLRMTKIVFFIVSFEAWENLFFHCSRLGLNVL